MLNNIPVTYYHPAVPPIGISVGQTYIVKEDERGIYLTDGNKIFDLSFEQIKMFFYPIGRNWHEVERGIL
jgi:hypothetical protein